MLVTLMHQDDKVLEFDYDLAAQAVVRIRPLDSPELALPGTLDGTPQANERLRLFLHSRALNPVRPDLDKILEATGVTSPFELAVRAGGFSLSDQYWYRTQPGALTWRGSNFFRNAWDTAFGEAVFACDFAALAKADIATPDVTCGGSLRKAWAFLDGKPHLLKTSSDGADAALMGEVLASRLLQLLLAPDDFVPHQLVVRDGTTYSASPLFVSEGVDLLSLSTMGITEARLTSDGTYSRPEWESFARKLDDSGIDGSRRFLSKLAVVSSLCLYGDTDASNLGVMQNHAAGTLRLAPIYDLDGSFGTFTHEVASLVRANQQLALRFVAWAFRSLEPSWDYSWCDLAPLDGFGQTVESMLGQCESLDGDYPAFARMLFESQLEYVASVVAPPSENE